MTHNEKGSATLHSVFAAVLLLSALAAATLWSTISTARHKLATAADVTALSAAQSLITPPAATDAGKTASGAAASDTTGAGTASGATGSDLTASSSTALNPTTPCAIAARIAALHKVDLVTCRPTPTSVTVQVALEMRLPLTHPTLTATARAGPL